jgi:GH24 family phage-related lysozyme (muramidase)
MDNRFMEMNSRLKQLKRNGRSNGFSVARSRSRLAGAFEAVNYAVPGIVGPIRQPSGMVCWATVTTMMISWRRQQSLSIETAIGAIGQNWLQKFQNNQGLSASEKIPFLNAAGFQFEYPQSLSIVGWEQMLRRYGPIWVTTDEDPSAGFAIHARIISAIRGDGTADGTFLTITDPARGNQYEEKFADFLRKYEEEVLTSGASWNGRIQIVHWPQAAASLTKSFSNERTRTWSVSTNGVAMIKRFEGFRGNLYNDPVGHCSVGYGELVHRGNCNGDASEQPYQNGITEERATELLRQRLNDFQRLINDTVTVELNQNQYDALVSFSYNVGSGNFRQSTLLRLLNQGNYGAVPTELRKWTKGRVNGQLVDLPGLVNRRNEEAALFAGTASTSQSLYHYSEATAVLPAPDLATLLDDNYPVRQLTITQARNILETMHQSAPGEINLSNANFSASALVPKTGNGETHNTARSFTVQPAVINGVQFKYMNAATSGIVLSNMNNLDPRMVVFLYKFTRWLKATYSADTVYHMGIGHGNAAHPFDCHNTGRAIDFGGVKGNHNGSDYELFVQRDWGSKPLRQANGSTQYRLSAGDGLAYIIFKDIYNYMVTQMSDTSRYYQGPLSAADLPARLIQDGTPIPLHAFIIHPDHQNSGLRSAHQNHIHAQVGPTGLETNPPV